MKKKIELANLEVPIMNAGEAEAAVAVVVAIIMIIARNRYASLSQTTRGVATTQVSILNPTTARSSG